MDEAGRRRGRLGAVRSRSTTTRRLRLPLRRRRREFGASQVARLVGIGPREAIARRHCPFLEAQQIVAIGVELAECRSEEHTSELQSLMRISYAVFCLKKKQKKTPQ